MLSFVLRFTFAVPLSGFCGFFLVDSMDKCGIFKVLPEAFIWIAFFAGWIASFAAMISQGTLRTCLKTFFDVCIGIFWVYFVSISIAGFVASLQGEIVRAATAEFASVFVTAIGVVLCERGQALVNWAADRLERR